MHDAIGQVPEAFDSIAATFGFKHHVGTDAALELKVKEEEE